MSDWVGLLALVIFFGTGAAVQFAEGRWPLRKYEAPRAWLVDSLGLAISFAATIAFRKAYPHSFAQLPNIPGLTWIPTVSHFVETNIPWPLAFVLSAVMLDFLLYVGHRLLHTSYLWHTHAVHHSVEHLYWLGGNRSSPFHVVFQLVWGALLGLVWPVNGGMTGAVAGMLLYTSIQHFNHANIRLRLGPLEWLFVMPRYHFVHHGADPSLNNSNFGFLLTIWDRMFGTYKNPDGVALNFPLGLNYRSSLTRLFIGMPPKRTASLERPEGVAPQRLNEV